MNTTIRERDIIFIEPGQPLSFEMLDGSLIISVLPIPSSPFNKGEERGGGCMVEYRFEKRVPPLIQAQKN